MLLTRAGLKLWVSGMLVALMSIAFSVLLERLA